MIYCGLTISLGNYIYTIECLSRTSHSISKKNAIIGQPMEIENVQFNKQNKNASELSESDVRQIVKEVLSGKTERFEELFDFYRAMVYAMAWNITGNYDDAMDVVQECFLRVYRALCSWKGRSKFSTWLHRIAVNTAIDYIRKEAKHHSKRTIEVYHQNKSEKFGKIVEGVVSKTPVDFLEQKELRARIMHAVNQLGGKQRRCFILRYFSGLSIKGVALVVCCSEGAVKRHLFRSRQNLKKWLISDYLVAEAKNERKFQT